jgi:long-chain acyl-CoA synthetase
MTPLEFPVGTNLGAMIAPHCADEQPWLIEVTPGAGHRVLTYGDLRDGAGAVARRLIADGRAARKARVGLIALNSAEYLVAYYGIMQAGCCAVPMGWKLTPETIAHVLRDATVELVYCDAKWASLLHGQVATQPIESAAVPADATRARTRLEPVPGMQPGEFATILYTSGSTGFPKGVPLTHGGYIWTLRQVEVNGGRMMREEAARVLTAAPLSHMNALFLAKTVTAYGATLVLMTTFEARAFLEAAAEHRCSIVTAVPTMLALAAREHGHPPALDLDGVKSVAMGSAPVTEALFAQVHALFPKAAVGNNWGTTETGPAVFGPHPRGLPRPPLALGHPLPQVEVRLDGGGDEGELLVRNGAVMPGYLNRDDETRKRLADGWYRTGDVMRRDADGFFYFVGRTDDMFVCGGENLYPGEIERLLETHPGVAQAAVIPVADEIKGQIPAAFIVRKPGATVTEDEVKAHALANGPVYQHPRFVRFIDEMPLSAANKIDKKRIRDMATDLGR